jgi:hypothetical protein
LAKASPGKLSFASGSNGSAGHLAGELFKTLAGIDIVHVPYKGGAPAMQDLLGGQVQFMFDNLANSTAQLKAGKLKAFAVTTAKRSVFAPEPPTMAEAGVPGFDISTWYGILAPGTPPDIVDSMRRSCASLASGHADKLKAQERRTLADLARGIRRVHPRRMDQVREDRQGFRRQGGLTPVPAGRRCRYNVRFAHFPGNSSCPSSAFMSANACPKW